MAKPPETRSIRKDAIEGAPDWLDGLLRPLNSFMSQVGDGLAANLSVQNLAARYADVRVTGGSQPKAFPVGIQGRKAACVLLAKVDGDAADFTASPGFLWAPCTAKDSKGLDVPGVQVTQVFGLTTGKQATFTLLVLGEE